MQQNQETTGQNLAMEKYYRFQSKIYDLTRWSFLFGRQEILRKIPVSSDSHILEIGCGTGYNLRRMAKLYPKARFSAFEVSTDMIRLSKKNTRQFKDRIHLIEAPFSADTVALVADVDVVLFSYSLTMINPQWLELIELALEKLNPGGYIAVVDFHDSRFSWFKKHMGNNHVRMDSHLLPLLEKSSLPVVKSIKKAYGGVWEYVVFIGKKPNTSVLSSPAPA